MEGLSPKQNRILNFISDFLEERGYPPTIRDIARACHISSTSVVEYNLNLLEQRGYIRRYPDISRGIELVSRHSEHIMHVPIIGRIAAGEPVPVPTAETWDSTATAETIPLPSELSKGRKRLYALRVKGTSMVDALINDSDLILMEQTNTVENGEMVAVWLKKEREATLKKFYQESNRIRLQPANNELKPIYTHPNNVEIQGKVICVIRQLD